MDFNSIFSKLCSNLEKEGKVKEISSQFSTCADNTQRVVFALNLAGPHLKNQLNSIQESRISPSKCQKLAVSHREDGNRFYGKKLIMEAMQSYNLSILVAAPGEQSLALAYANRSAVLYDLGDWLHCLRDIQLALGTGCYPRHLEHKLHERQGNCWLQLGDRCLALDSFTRAINSPSIPEDKSSIISSKLDQLSVGGGLVEEQPSIESIEGLIFAQSRPPLPELNRPRNPLLPCASLSVRMVQSVDKGRCLVATEALEPGTPKTTRYCRETRVLKTLLTSPRATSSPRLT